MDLYAACLALFAVFVVMSTACTVLFVLRVLSRWRAVPVPFGFVRNDMLPWVLYSMIGIWHHFLRKLIKHHNDTVAPELQVHWMTTCLGVPEHILPLLALLLQLGYVYDLLKPTGLSPAQIAALGVSEYQGYLTDHGDEGAEEECCICLAEFVRSDNVRVIPGCRHVYHRDCIDRWLSLKSLCPRCNSPSGLPR